jgi:hypothetical protein
MQAGRQAMSGRQAGRQKAHTHPTTQQTTQAQPQGKRQQKAGKRQRQDTSPATAFFLERSLFPFSAFAFFFSSFAVSGLSSFAKVSRTTKSFPLPAAIIQFDRHTIMIYR